MGPRFRQTTTLVPDARRLQARAAAEAGFGPDNFNIPVGPAGGRRITHWASDMAISLREHGKAKAAAIGIPGATIARRPLADELSGQGLVIRRDLEFGRQQSPGASL